MYRPLPLIQEPLAELEARLRQERSSELRPRLHLLVLIASHRIRSQAEAATHLALHRNTISRYLTLYRRGGLDALLQRNKGGAPAEQRSLTLPVMEALQAQLAGEGFEGYTEVHRWLEAEHSVKLPYATVHRLVRYRLRAKLKRARPSNAKKTSRMQPTSLDA
ncbi:MAG: helix-turn-helix domain containing protein [Gemmatimonadetes bacterium]|nr:helix-turn-helix domain containing protein [Gemmatimonadota bacterium]